MTKNYDIAPSILSANFACLGEDVTAVLAAGATRIHFDVMDNHYVPNLSFGPVVCQALRRYGINAPIDVHLMITPVDNLIEPFVQAGATSITFHPEASLHPHRTMQLIRNHKIQAGLAVNPGTPITLLEPLLDDIDRILVMSVNPGFGGQAFLSSSLSKIKVIHQLIQNKPICLEVDGGITCANIKAIAEAGAQSFVAGSAIFGSDDYRKTIAEMQAELSSCHLTT